MKQPTVPAPHPLAELIAQMLTGVAHVPRVEQARMVADAAKAAAKWHDARVAELEQAIADERECRKVLLRRLTVVEDELLRVRTTQGAAAHALDVLRQAFGLDLVDGEHPSDTARRITAAANARVAELEAVLRATLNAGYDGPLPEHVRERAAAALAAKEVGRG